MLENSRKIFILISLMVCGMGLQFNFDLLQGVSTPIYNIFQISTEQFHSLYTLGNVLGFLLTPLGGYLTSKIGLGPSAVLYTFLILLGTSISYIGVRMEVFGVLKAGFMIFSMGGESLITTQVASIVKWFFGKNLAFCLGCKFAFS